MTAANVHAGAGTLAPPEELVNVRELLAAYADRPDPAVAAQRVSFGTSGHRGSSLNSSFNEWHVLAIAQAICEHRARQGIDGPLFIGIDTHALSEPAFRNALEVLAANGVEAQVAAAGEFTPTPVISHAILAYNRGRSAHFADGIVLTPSHNPPEDGGFKYNPPHGGPADSGVTGLIEARANVLLEASLAGVRRMPYERARLASTTHERDYLSPYVADLGSVIDLDAIRSAGIRMGVDPLGGAGVHYWARIAETWRLDLEVISTQLDPTFGFMSRDWDGRIRMDPSSAWAMQRLIAVKDRYDIAFACDTDHDRHGIVTPQAGLLPANHYLAVVVDYLFGARRRWPDSAAVGKTAVSTALIDRVAARLGRRVHEVPVGFKWFVEGLLDGSLGLGGEESAGMSFNRIDGSVWTTDKDGITAALLAAEIGAATGKDPGERYQGLTDALGAVAADRVEAPANAAQRRALARLTAAQLNIQELAGEAVSSIADRAPGNGAPLGGIKVIAPNGWFAARPSGTENIYKIYAESFRGEEHLRQILREAQRVVDATLAS